MYNTAHLGETWVIKRLRYIDIRNMASEAMVPMIRFLSPFLAHTLIFDIGRVNVLYWILE